MKKFEKPIMVTQSFLPPIEEYKEQIDRIWENNWVTNQGPIHKEFNKCITKYLKVNNSTLFVNGHLALDVAIKALNLKGEVITTPFTFASTTHAIKMNGVKPVFCDINVEDYTIDVSKIERLITKETSAIIPVHVFGTPCDVEGLQKIAEKYKLKIIYDAAHIFGVEVNGVGIGNFGDVSMFSLHATKVFNSIEGGVLTYNNLDYKRQFDLLKNFGITDPETVEAVGLNAKMNEFQAAMGLVNLRYIDEEINKRKKVVKKYRECLKDIQGITYLKDKIGIRHNYAYFPILVDEIEYGKTRNDLFKKLKEHNVFARKYFYPLVNEYDCYKNDYNVEDTPVAKYVGDRVLTLPMYGSLELDKVENICEIIKQFSK
ncbi:DegT/DnrJ/EryC1/StrS family aminotransferase [Clostridium estertheticum]|uniref:DegT/DnrJ/EryC1/StrS family aminotransferase n=1 Tax=Clostridium estertheticum TaxID=238834 RepID=UPI001C7CB381|nr:DegT/DnrJ/EryC1/StrS family aminotransferase [Clostridium estertheticum]MBX4258432.1 DegT/DnrJ/EryC1/StrS family aminotransferase [Clostridium estertheticum]WLC69613.1 DegT/DnrJ/EryC1/StrS family aminotransferase [Clostridium estertheticum]